MSAETQGRNAEAAEASRANARFAGRDRERASASRADDGAPTAKKRAMKTMKRDGSSLFWLVEVRAFVRAQSARVGG